MGSLSRLFAFGYTQMWMMYSKIPKSLGICTKGDGDGDRFSFGYFSFSLNDSKSRHQQGI